MQPHVIRPLESDATLLSDPAYDPNHFIDVLLAQFQLKNDAALCRLLEIAPPVLSKIRHKRLAISAAILLRVHEKTEIPVRELKALAGMASHTGMTAVAGHAGMPLVAPQPEALAA